MTSNQKIGLGTVQFGLPYGISNISGQTPLDEVDSILKTAKGNGIKILDSASAYGNAEEVLGKNDLSGFEVVSKFMPPIPGKTVRDQFEESLKKLQISTMYGYLAHRPMEILSSPRQWEHLKDLKNRGQVKKIGFSLNEPNELKILLKEGYLPDLVQVPFNYFDRRFEKAIKEMRHTGCEIHTRSAFLQGLFFLDPDGLDDFFAEVKPILNILRNQGNFLSGKLLKFCLDQPFIDQVIIGVENADQLVQNLEGLKVAGDLPILDKIISDKILIPSGWPRS